MKKILVTCAFPYANGPIHLGHILEHIHADIWVKFNRLIGNKVYFICSDDSHGTSILLRSIKLKINPYVMINKILLDHKIKFLDFNILHDFYYTTHNKYNYYFLKKLLFKFKNRNILFKDKILQFYDTEFNMFLSDRYIKGTCYKCNKSNQYENICSYCNNILNINKLIDPISVISNCRPILKYTDHLFININKFKYIIKDWIINSFLQKKIVNQINYWLNSNLINWNISRDKPYFGFKIPSNFIINKYFYVWIDALLGYISTFFYFCKVKKLLFLFNEFWNTDSNYEIYHFIGKDILYFHGILWPIILDCLNFRKPSGLIVHGHLLFNNSKMSKSNNYFISLSKWLKFYDIDSIRYYFASYLDDGINDINLSIKDFVNKINSDIVNRYVNIASRISYFINNFYNNFLSKELFDINFYNYFIYKSVIIKNFFLNFNYSKVILLVNNLLDNVNKYINDYKPWVKIKEKKYRLELHMFCTTILNVFKIISIYLCPIIPSITNKIEKFLQTKLVWSNLKIPLLNHKILKYKNIYSKINLYNLNI